MARAEGRRATRAQGQHRSLAKSGRRPAVRVTSESAYRSLPKRSRPTFNRVLDLSDEWDRTPGQPLSRLSRRHGTTVRSVERYLPTEKVGGRVRLVPPSRRRPYRGEINVPIDRGRGGIEVVRITPANDAERRKAERLIAAIFQSERQDEPAALEAMQGEMIRTADGRRLPLATSPGKVHEAFLIGEVLPEDLYYEGGHRHDLDAQLASGSGQLGEEP